MFSGRRNIFLQNLAAKSTRKVVHFFPISLIGHVDFHLFSPWVAWLSSFQSSLKSIHPPKNGGAETGLFVSLWHETAAQKSEQRIRTEHSQPRIYRYWPFGKHWKNLFKKCPTKRITRGGKCAHKWKSSSLHIDYKHFDYVVEQAIAGDQVVYRMAIRNNILLQWASLKHSEKYHIDLLNDIIPGTVVRIILN